MRGGRILQICFVFVMIGFGTQFIIAQPLQDIKICLDPGHGGYGSNDRMTELPHGIVYWESEGDLIAGLALRDMLIELGADVKMTRTGNTEEEDLALSERTAIANAFGADFFHSIHTNGGGGNYSLVLYEEISGSPQFSAAMEMSDLMAPLLQDLMRTEANYSRGDESFLGFNLGVLKNSDMPSTLSESSFHDLPEEGLRLKNEKYLENYAWAMAKSFLEYFNTDGFTTGRVGGIISDNFTGNPLNEIQIEIQPGDLVYQGDTNYNGFYAMGDLVPGEYELFINREGYLSDTLSFEILANEYTEVDQGIQFFNNGMPLVDFIVDELPAEPGKLLTFDASNTLDDKGIELFEWDFGDGTEPDTGMVVGHTFNSSGEFEVTLMVTDLEGNEASLSKTIEVVSIPPSMPHLLAVDPSAADNVIKLIWTENPEDNILRYNIYYTQDDELTDFTLLRSVNADSTSIELTEFANINQPHYFKITAENVSNQESNYSDTYTGYISEGEDQTKILIVDGFTRTSSYASPNHSFSKIYAEGLYSLTNIAISSVSNTTVVRDSIDLDDYDLVFWFLGDESTVDETFTTLEQAILAAFLENGGNLFVTGAEIGWDLYERGSDEDKLFYNNYLKADYLADGGLERSPAIGIDGSEFEDNILPFGIIYVEDYPDEIGPIGGSTQILTYINNQGAGIGYKGSFGDSEEEGGIVNIGFALETVADKALISHFLIDVVDYLLGLPTSTDQELINEHEITLYPNVAQLEINVHLQESIDQDIELNVYNDLGQWVKVKTSKAFQGNTISVRIDDLTPGTYFLVAAYNGIKSTHKFIKI